MTIIQAEAGESRIIMIFALTGSNYGIQRTAEVLAEKLAQM